MTKHQHKSHVQQGRKVGFCLQLPGHVPWLREERAGTQVRNLEVGTEAETMAGCCLLAYSVWLGWPDFYTTPRLVPPTEGLAGLLYIHGIGYATLHP